MIRKILQHKFIRASFWVFFATGVINIGNYLYHLLMGRMLGPSLYGELEGAVSVLYLLNIPLLTLTIGVMKFVSVYKGKQKDEQISALYNFLNRDVLIWGIIVSCILLLCSPLLINFLHLPSYMFAVILVLAFFSGLFLNLNRSFLQGLSRFAPFATSNFIETFGKLLFAVGLVYIGLKAEGALLGFLIGSLLSVIFTVWVVRIAHKGKGTFTEKKTFFKYLIPVFLMNLAFTSLYTSDVLLVRNLFSSMDSGYYAALSVLGKVIYFAIYPIILVMFPFVSEHHAKGSKYTHFLFLSIGFAVLAIAAIVSIYFAFPQFMVLILFGKKFLAISPYVGMFGLFIGLYCLCFIMTNFYLSIHKTKPVVLGMGTAIIQVILIYVFNNNSLLTVIQISIACTFLLLISLLVYYPYATRKVK